MKLNMTMNIKVNFEPYECIKLLEKSINYDFKDSFKFFPLVSNYRLYPSQKYKNNFDLHRTSLFDRYTAILGNVKKENQQTIICLKAYPPIWFYLFFSLGFAYLMIMSSGFRATYPFVIVWLGFCMLAIFINIYIAKRIFSNILRITKGRRN
jgi:hypothetical protein